MLQRLMPSLSLSRAKRLTSFTRRSWPSEIRYLPNDDKGTIIVTNLSKSSNEDEDISKKKSEVESDERGEELNDRDD